MKKSYIIIVAFIVLLLVAFLLFPKITHKSGDNTNTTGVSIEIDDAVFNVDIADNEADRNKGLSGRSQISFDGGMLFVFENSGIYPFWMKDMNFPIDIIWIDKDLQVVYLKENADPKSYPEMFVPNKFAQYVLEVKAGTIRDGKIKIGDSVDLNISNVK